MTILNLLGIFVYAQQSLSLLFIEFKSSFVGLRLCYLSQ